MDPTGATDNNDNEHKMEHLDWFDSITISLLTIMYSHPWTFTNDLKWNAINCTNKANCCPFGGDFKTIYAAGREEDGLFVWVFTFKTEEIVVLIIPKRKDESLLLELKNKTKQKNPPHAQCTSGMVDILESIAHVAVSPEVLE